jgi:CRISPR/Cas system-associated exonuclease Cas4 (RecB family)
MEQCMERVDDTMLRIGMVPTEYERNLDVNPRPETHGFALTGRADMLDATHMVELKATSELRREHYLQVALYMYMMQVNGCAKPHNYLYNVLSDELVEIRCDCLVELVDDLITAKLSMQKETTDEEFLARH